MSNLIGPYSLWCLNECIYIFYILFVFFIFFINDDPSLQAICVSNFVRWTENLKYLILRFQDYVIALQTQAIAITQVIFMELHTAMLT